MGAAPSSAARGLCARTQRAPAPLAALSLADRRKLTPSGGGAKVKPTERRALNSRSEVGVRAAAVGWRHWRGIRPWTSP